MNYVRNLRFKEKPDYKYLRQLFRELFDQINRGSWDCQYDWNTRLKPEELRKRIGKLKGHIKE